MGLRLQRAALPELLAHPAHRRHAKPQKFRDLSSALVPFIELQNAPTHGKRYGSHKHTLSHIFLFVKLHYLWKCSKYQVSIDRVTCRRSNRGREQRIRESNRNYEIRAPKYLKDRIRDADDFPLTIEEETAGAARGGLRVEDNFVGQDISDVALRNDRMNEIAAGQLRQNLRDVA